MFTQLKKRSEGFTIVELLIVIVVIGILAALVLNTFAGVQQRARDTERKTDINAIHTQIEVFYNDNGYYPNGSTVALDGTSLPGIDDNALLDPEGLSVDIGTASTPPADYFYEPTCAAPAQCETYVLTGTLEGDDGTYVKNALN